MFGGNAMSQKAKSHLFCLTMPIFVSDRGAQRLFATAIACRGCVRHLFKHGLKTNPSDVIFVEAAAE